MNNIPVFLAQIIPPRNPNRDPVALEAAMQSLVLDERHPIALEIAGTATSKQFLLRATTAEGLHHALSQLRARYPQAGIVPVAPTDDPLHYNQNETASVVELKAGNASYLPLRTWQEYEMKQDGVDPLLGVFAALDSIPTGMRVVAQIGMVPATPTWSQASQRRAVEHPLEPERMKQRLQMHPQESAPSGVSLIGMALCLAGIFLLARYPHAVPSWVSQAALTMVQGHDPQLSPAHLLFVLLWGGGILAVLVLLMLLFGAVRRRLRQKTIYDQKLVNQKTMRMAYRVRIRLYVITPRVLPHGHLSALKLLRRGWHLLHLLLFQYPGRWYAMWRSLRVAQTRRQAFATLFRWHWREGRRVLGNYRRTWYNIRWAARLRRTRLSHLIAAYRQFHLASGNYFVARRVAPWTARWLLMAPRGVFGLLHGWWRGIRHSSHYIGVDTLAALWHLLHGPVLSTIALMDQRRARSFPLPPVFLRTTARRQVMGYVEHAGSRLPFALPPSCMKVHTLIGGKSGEGKSTCIEHIAREVMESGSGLLLIDPHGDLSEHVLMQVPADRVDDVVWINLADLTHSVGINPLDCTLGRGRDKAVADLLHTLSHIWASSWGPRMENAFEMALRTLYEANKVLVAKDRQNGPQQQYTLLDVLPLLTDESFLHALLAKVNDPFLHRWWFTYYAPLSLMQQRDIINPVISKTTKFESEIARRIIGQGCSTIDFAQLIREHKIILVKLAKGEIGSDVAPLLGATILGLVQMTLEEQGQLDATQRIQLPIIIDEFQALEGTDYGALAELRKYGATFFLATQSFAYLHKFNPTLLATVFANVKNFLIYHISAEDALVIHRELGVEPEDITTLDSHLCYVRLTYQDQRQPVFSCKFLLPPAGDAAQAQHIRLQSQEHYMRPVADIDEQLRNSVIRTLAMHAQSVQPDPAQANGNQPAPGNSGNSGNGTNGTAPVKKKQKGAWPKGGQKNQKSPVTPSAFANTTTPQDANAQSVDEDLHKDESEDAHGTSL